MIPYVRDLKVAYGACDQVSPLIRRVTADNPGPFTFLGTGTYIVGRGEVAVIDPGPDMPDHLDAILRAVDGERVSHILITHHHADHSPLAAALQAATGAPIYGCAVTGRASEDDTEVPMEAGHDLAFRPDISLCDVGEVSGQEWTLEAIPTPGHTSNHLCFALPQENALFCGDHIMGWSTTVIIPPDDDMGDYLRSHANWLYVAAVTPETTNAATRLTKIKNGKLADRDGVLLDSFTIRHFYQKHWAGRCAQGRRRAGGF